MRFLRSALPVILLLLPALAAAQPEPGTIDDLVATYIESFNSGDEERMIAFLKEYGVPSMEPVKNEGRGRRLYRMLRNELGTISGEGATFIFTVPPAGNPRGRMID